MKKFVCFMVTLFIIQFANAQASIKIADLSTPVRFETVETPPIFPGGNDQFIKFFSSNFHAPEVEGLSGVMKVNFVIDTNGNVADINILNDLGSGCAEEVKRVLKLSPKWSPGEQDGKLVRVLFTLPVTINN